MKSNPASSSDPATKNRRIIARLFWLSFLVISLAYAWYCFYAPSNEVSWSTDFTTAQEQAVQSGKPMILFFTATWCSPCRIMKRTIWADEQVTTEVNERFIPLMLYADDPHMAEVFTRYGVRATPTTLILDPQGNALDGVYGKVEKEKFLTFLRKPYSENK
jgi:protein disulfide-isomerase